MRNKMVTVGMKISSLFIFFLICSPVLFAQPNSDFCATDIKVAESLKNNPVKLKNFMQQREQNRENDKQRFANGYAAEKASSILYIVPIVFHIIHQGGPENVSDAQVYDAVRILNNDFRKLNSDTTQIVPAFQNIAADCQIEFRLAQLDPDGNCTNGIDRIYSNQTHIGDDGSKLNPWPHNKYYNVWVVKSISPGGIAGYAYYPGTAPPGADGVIILQSYLGSIGTSQMSNSRVLTHETGHYLDLPHVWGSTNSPGVACGDDWIGDTPDTKGWTSCNLNGSICTAGVIENVQNYMEYSYCCKMFTWGQKASMVAALNSSAGLRNQLWTSSNLIATGASNQATLCSADFNSFPNATSLCSGEPVTFKDLSFNGAPTSWIWTLPGATFINGTSATDSMPVVEYASAGTYDVSLSVSNNSGTVSKTKTGYVIVSPSIPVYNSNFYSESFETAALPGSDWNVVDIDGGGNSWTLTNLAHVSGLASAYLNNANSLEGDADELIGPPINISAIGSPYFSFYYAYAPGFSPSTDQLLVYVSSNCGKTWYQRKTIAGTSLATAAATLAPFVPAANEWKQAIVNLNNVLNQSNVRFKFKFLGGSGNNVYIDDINIISTVDVPAIQDANHHLSVYPNPFLEGTLLSFFLAENSFVDIDITNVLGQHIQSVPRSYYTAGNNKAKIKAEPELVPGVYFLNLMANNKQSRIKISVR